MSTVGSITKLATEVVGKAAHAVTHPRKTVSAVTGHARDLTASVKRADHKDVEPLEQKPSDAADAPDAPDVYVSPDRHVEPAEPVPPAQSVEPSTTEPKAASRDAAHHGRGSEPSDDWHDELEDGPDVGINPATGQPNARQGDDEPLIDPSVAKAIRSEAETMKKASDPER
jgi:hypothetical protein